MYGFVLLAFPDDMVMNNNNKNQITTARFCFLFSLLACDFTAVQLSNSGGKRS